MTSTKNTRPSAPKYKAVYQEEFDDYNLVIESGVYAGLVFRILRLGFLPQPDESVMIKFQYDVINVGVLTEEQLTSEDCKYTIIEVIKDYLNLENNVGSH
jgi:hypothetical protein